MSKEIVKAHTVTLIHGDGIGKEVVDATRKLIDATGALITWEEHEAGANVFKKRSSVATKMDWG
ncbi:hypothetical protein EBR03_03200 [bacterium]|nr:hypothetical protein [bacterium]